MPASTAPAWDIQFAGPPRYVAGLGMLPGTPTRLVDLRDPSVVYIVDDRNAGETAQHGAAVLLVISLVRALALLTDKENPEPDPEPPQAPAGPVVELLATRRAAELLGIDPAELAAMADEAPAHLPGAPMRRGRGQERVHWRWDPATLDEFPKAYTAWRSEQAARAAAPSAVRAPRRRGATARSKTGSLISRARAAQQE